MFLIGQVVAAQQTAVPVKVSFPDDKSLVLLWASNSNELYEVSFRTNLIENQSVSLKRDILATPPINELTIHRGSVPSAYFQAEVQAVLGSALPYELILPNNPTFVGTFCITNDTQFEAMKNELGLAGRTFDFSTKVVIGLMAPETSSITGRYEMDYVRDAADEVLVFCHYVDYYPYCSPAFHKEVFVVKTEHKNKPVRMVHLETVFPHSTGYSWPVSIDPNSAWQLFTGPVINLP